MLMSINVFESIDSTTAKRLAQHIADTRPDFGSTIIFDDVEYDVELSDNYDYLVAPKSTSDKMPDGVYFQELEIEF